MNRTVLNAGANGERVYLWIAQDGSYHMQLSLPSSSRPDRETLTSSSFNFEMRYVNFYEGSLDSHLELLAE